MLNTIASMVRMVALLHTVDSATVDAVEGNVARVCTVDACVDVRTTRGQLREGQTIGRDYSCGTPVYQATIGTIVL